jgi:ubiquinone/menaquinone biosynthesis C-methylase UbiE
MMQVTREQYDQRWQDLRRGGYESNIFAVGRPRTQVEFIYAQYNEFVRSRLADAFGKLDGLSFLEVGCGRGTTSMYFAVTHGLECTLLDFSFPAVALAKQNFDRAGIPANYVQGDVFHLPFEDNSFDVICSIGLLEHFTDVESILKEALRVLRPGGLHISLNAVKTPGHLLDPVERWYSTLAVVAGRITAGFRHFAWHKLRRAHVIFQPIPKNSGVPRFRSDYTPGYFHEVAGRVGFCNVQAVSVNPFPIFRPAAPRVDRLITELYSAILAARRGLGVTSPFATSHRRGRAHFLWGTKA